MAKNDLILSLLEDQDEFIANIKKQGDYSYQHLKHSGYSIPKSKNNIFEEFTRSEQEEIEKQLREIQKHLVEASFLSDLLASNVSEKIDELES